MVKIHENKSAWGHSPLCTTLTISTKYLDQIDNHVDGATLMERPLRFEAYSGLAVSNYMDTRLYISQFVSDYCMFVHYGYLCQHPTDVRYLPYI